MDAEGWPLDQLDRAYTRKEERKRNLLKYAALHDFIDRLNNIVMVLLASSCIGIGIMALIMWYRGDL